MSTRIPKADHCVMDTQHQALLCQNCGGSHKLNLPLSVSMMVAITKQFNTEHKSCAKTWTPPPPFAANHSRTKEQRIVDWLASGERGISSDTILEVVTGTKCTDRFGRRTPSDPDDFRRCHLLLEAVPELRDGFPKLAKESKAWAGLVRNWDDLTNQLRDLMRTNKDNGMYERMKALGC